MSKEIPKHVAEAMNTISNYCKDFTTVECQRGDCPLAYGKSDCLLKKEKVADWTDTIKMKYFIKR